MRIGKPLLLVTTSIGVVAGVYEAFRLTGGLAFLMIALLLVIGAGMGMVIMTIRREKQAERAAKEAGPAAATPPLPAHHDGDRH